MAAFTEIVIEQGATFETVIDVTDIYNNPVNITGFTANSAMRKSYVSSTSYILSSALSDAANGEITLSMTAANTALLPAGRLLYDLKITSSTGIVTRVVEGVAVVLPSITR